MKTGNYYPENTDLRYTPTTHEEERALFAKARAGDAEAREFIIKNHLLFAAIQGRRWAYGKLSEDEVVSAANLAVMMAIDKFDHTRPQRFTAYLRPFIRGQIANLWRSKNAFGEHAPEFPEKSLENARMQDVDEELSEDHPVEEDDHRRFILGLLEKSKGLLTDMEREVIRRYFNEDPEQLANIGDDHNLTRARIHQIKDSALKKLRREMARNLKKFGVER